MKLLITNCPNCGGTLSESGDCPYCNTKIRYENEIKITTTDFSNPEPVEILIKRQNGETVNLAHFVGYISSLQYSYEPIYCPLGSNNRFLGSSEPEVNITFTGRFKNVKNTSLNK